MACPLILSRATRTRTVGTEHVFEAGILWLHDAITKYLQKNQGFGTYSNPSQSCDRTTGHHTVDHRELGVGEVSSEVAGSRQRFSRQQGGWRVVGGGLALVSALVLMIICKREVCRLAKNLCWHCKDSFKQDKSPRAAVGA